MQDTLAYLRHYNFPISDWVKALMREARYQKVFLLDPLPVYEHDYARTENPDSLGRLQGLLRDAYAEFGMQPIHVPATSPSERAQFILNQLTIRGKV